MTGASQPFPLRNWLRLAKAIGSFRYARLKGRQPIYVYQMGKVGSSALASLINRVPGYNAVQIHRLMPERTAEIRSRFDRGERYYRDMRFEQWLYREIHSHDGPVWVVTAVREPMAHSYSAFFQNLPRSTGGTMSDPTPDTIQDLRDRFLSWDDLGAALTWLDVEASALTGCDLLAQPFDLEAGWTVVEQGRFRILLLKAELENTRKRAAIHGFLGRDPGALVQTNSATDKAYAAAYRSFIDQVKLPAALARCWADHRYTRRFYSEDEIAAALAQFSGVGKKRR